MVTVHLDVADARLRAETTPLLARVQGIAVIEGSEPPAAVDLRVLDLEAARLARAPSALAALIIGRGPIAPLAPVVELLPVERIEDLPDHVLALARICREDGRVPVRGGVVDLRLGALLRGGAAEPMSPSELRLLAYLAARPGRDVAREELLERAWGYSPHVRSRTVDTTARRLRERVEADPSRPEVLISVHGVGYRFAPPAGEPAARPELGPEAREVLEALSPWEASLDADALRAVLGPALWRDPARLSDVLYNLVSVGLVLAERGLQEPPRARYRLSPGGRALQLSQDAEALRSRLRGWLLDALDPSPPPDREQPGAYRDLLAEREHLELLAAGAPPVERARLLLLRDALVAVAGPPPGWTEAIEGLGPPWPVAELGPGLAVALARARLLASRPEAALSALTGEAGAEAAALRALALRDLGAPDEALRAVCEAGAASARDAALLRLAEALVHERAGRLERARGAATEALTAAGEGRSPRRAWAAHAALSRIERALGREAAAGLHEEARDRLALAFGAPAGAEPVTKAGSRVTKTRLSALAACGGDSSRVDDPRPTRTLCGSRE